MRKKILIIVTAIFSFFVIGFIGLTIYYKTSINSYDKNIDVNDPKNNITVSFNSGSTSKDLINLLYDSGLIKNKYVGYAYIKLNKKIILQAGTYELNKGMSLVQILSKIEKGEIVDNSIAVTFIEGKRLTNYVKVISEKFNIDEEKIYKKLEDEEYLSKLIEKYWFLTDEILNDKLYYALEGYLYPDTYHFFPNDDIESIIDKMLTETGKKLSSYKEEIESGKYTYHEILTLASIIEIEGSNSNDRKGVAGVFYNRLNAGWSLGSDVTTYYGAKVDMAERDLYIKEIETPNAYNTRHPSMAGKLPVGPICSPSIESITAAIEPTEHDYYYFVADKNKNTYFTKNQAEHEQKIAELKRQGLWYEYGKGDK